MCSEDDKTLLGKKHNNDLWIDLGLGWRTLVIFLPFISYEFAESSLEKH